MRAGAEVVNERLERPGGWRSLASRVLRKQKVSLTREQALLARPIRNEAAKQTEGEEGEVVLEVQRRRDWFDRLLGFIVAAPLTKKLALDEMGGFVWRLCDGDRSVKEIASLLAQEYKLGRREATLSLSSFLSNLGKRGLIGFALIEEKQNGRPKK